MKPKLAKSAGFCFGVSRAVGLVEKTAAENRGCYTLGPIIHNRFVVKSLEDKGVFELSSPEQAPEGSTVVIRSHGASRAELEALEKKGVNIVDATCPFVKKIHKIVISAEERGRIPVIIGTRAHPEIVAMAGWCANPLIFQSPQEIQAWLDQRGENAELPISVVSQTTSTKFLWEDCLKIIKKVCTNAEIFDTICNATEVRQGEAKSLAESCDAMVVVGDASSSNTKRLAEICREFCPLVALIDHAGELDMETLKGKTAVGLTAGASTPAWIIKEVYDKMSDEIKESVNTGAANDAAEEVEESFDELLEKSFKTLSTGEKVTGIVTAISPTEVSVDLGAKQAGYIPISEITDDPSVKAEDVFKVGEEVETYIIRVNDVEGTVMLSKKRLDTVKSWDEVEAAKDDKTVMEGIVTEENKGGVVVSIKGVRVFVPASQTGLGKDAPMSALLKKKVRLRITEVNRARRRVVGSIRAVAFEERKAMAEQVWNEIEEGKKYDGIVKSLTSYGAFVDIGGVDGMVHVSELSWSRVKHPSEVVKVGDQIPVYVIAVDKEKKKISLGYKTQENNPWKKFTETYNIGDTAKVKVVKMMTFGAFAEVLPGVDGLIHISQIADRRINKPEDVLSEGQEVEVKIIDVDYDKQKISLSIRALLQPEAPAEDAPAAGPDEVIATFDGTQPVEEAPAE